MDSARADMLARIGAALRDRPAAPRIPRDYRGTGAVDPDLNLFVERVADYRATVHRCQAAAVDAAISGILSDRRVTRVVVPDGFPQGWLPSVAVIREPVDLHTLEDVGAVLTTCAAAVAETGTIVLDAGPGQGPRALTLIPDYHLVVVAAGQVVALVPDAVAAVGNTRPLTWISGPSATSDIELKRVEGVHGPRTLDVLLVD